MRVAVLCGGTSAERDVSLVSGRAVGLALTKRSHDVLLVDPAEGDSPIGAREAAAAAVINRDAPAIRHETGSAIAAIQGEAVRSADVVFIALHGGTGEDGTVQGLLELAGKKYTGSGVLASALAMDKRAAKVILNRVHVPTPAWQVVTFERALPPDARGGSPTFPSDGGVDEAAGVVNELGGYPVVVKPNDQGSTVGLTVVEDEERLLPAVKLAGEYSRHVLLETYIPGRELTVAVLGGQALPVVEILPKNGIYDYESKYGKGMSEYTCPAEIPALLSDQLKANALMVFAALGCRGYARVDYRLSPAGKPYCLEANTVPGMTEFSLVPMAAAAVGIGFGELVQRIAEMALK
ncbi:MAG: D-alanine--D-alanine ligase [Candidatus Eisenbacteria sp.]|nr:D-alanine--D-alanine ligase [Candidatus Eisenbacteria bacterium]